MIAEEIHKRKRRRQLRHRKLPFPPNARATYNYAHQFAPILHVYVYLLTFARNYVYAVTRKPCPTVPIRIPRLDFLSPGNQPDSIYGVLLPANPAQAMLSRIETNSTKPTTSTATTYAYADSPSTNGTTHYHHDRFHDLVTVSWPSRDPIGEQGGNNLYAMVDAVNRADHLGKNPVLDTEADFQIIETDNITRFIDLDPGDSELLQVGLGTVWGSGTPMMSIYKNILFTCTANGNIVAELDGPWKEEDDFLSPSLSAGFGITGGIGESWHFEKGITAFSSGNCAFGGRTGSGQYLYLRVEIELIHTTSVIVGWDVPLIPVDIGGTIGTTEWSSSPVISLSYDIAVTCCCDD